MRSSLSKFISIAVIIRVSHWLAGVAATYTKSYVLGFSLLSHRNKNEKKLHIVPLAAGILIYLQHCGQLNLCQVYRQALDKFHMHALTPIQRNAIHCNRTATNFTFMKMIMDSFC